MAPAEIRNGTNILATVPEDKAAEVYLPNAVMCIITGTEHGFTTNVRGEIVNHEEIYSAGIQLADGLWAKPTSSL